MKNLVYSSVIMPAERLVRFGAVDIQSAVRIVNHHGTVVNERLTCVWRTVEDGMMVRVNTVEGKNIKEHVAPKDILGNLVRDMQGEPGVTVETTIYLDTDTIRNN